MSEQRSTDSESAMRYADPNEDPKMKQHYELLARFGRDIILFIRPSDGQIIDCNDAAIEAYGYSRSEIVSLRIHDLRSPDGRSLIREQLNAANLSGIAFENFHCRKDGTAFPVEVSSKGADLDGERIVISIIRDITERKLAEKRLRESEEAYRALVSGLPDIVVRFDRQGRHLFASDSTHQMVDLTPAQFIGKTHRELGFSEKSCLFWEEVIQRVLRTAQAWETEFVLDGNTGPMFFNCRLIPEFDANDDVQSILSISRDTTMHRQMEERYKMLFREMLNGFAVHEIICDESGCPVDCRFLAVNPAFERLTGLKAEQIVGKTLLEVLPDTEPRWIDIYGNVALTGEPAFFMDYHAGLQKYYEVAAYQPAPNQLACIFADVTERKRTEEELHDSRERLRLALSSSEMGVWRIDLCKQKRYFDDQVCRCLGIDSSRFTGTAEEFYAAVHPEDRDQLKAALNKTIQIGAAYEVEYRTVWPDGTIHFIASRAQLSRDDNGQLHWINGLLWDITGHIRAEEERSRLASQLQQAQKMESVGRLAGGIAHDFNNMLGVILGRAEMALDQIDRTEPVYEDLAEIQKAGKRSADLTRQLLAFARKQTVAPRTLNLNETIAGMLKMIERLIGENIAIDWQPALSLWPVMMDPSQIDQILANLCVNARDAISGAGRIILQTGNCTLDEEYCAVQMNLVPGEYVRLTVNDNGCGMDKEILDHIFEPFFTTKKTGEGTGLGLATIYGIVKQNKGCINVYSRPGQGTTFSIYIPHYHGDTVGAPAESAISAQGDNETILLVEDEPAILSLAMRILERQGYKVLAASTPGEAIQIAGQHADEIQMLITDVVMPEMNGRELVNKLLPLNPQLKRLFMSGYTADLIAQQGVLEPGVNFIQKPFSAKELAAKVKEVLSCQ
jgi:PAS domain S-box-containing protein